MGRVPQGHRYLSEVHIESSQGLQTKQHLLPYPPCPRPASAPVSERVVRPRWDPGPEAAGWALVLCQSGASWAASPRPQTALCFASLRSVGSEVTKSLAVLSAAAGHVKVADEEPLVTTKLCPGT